MNANEMRTLSEQWREGLGVFDTEDELNRSCLTRPLDALAKVLGLKTLSPGPALKQQDDMVIANRRAAYGITSAK